MLTVIHFGMVTVFKPVHRSWIRNIFCSDGEQFILEFSIRAKEGRVYIFFSSILAFLTPILDELFHFGVTVCEKVSISDSQNCCKLHVNLSSKKGISRSFTRMRWWNSEKAHVSIERGRSGETWSNMACETIDTVDYTSKQATNGSIVGRKGLI